MGKVPQNLKFKKYFKASLSKKNIYSWKLSCLRNSVGLQSFESGKLDSKQIEACRVSIRRKLGKKKKKFINLWIKVFPYFSFTRKPVGMRMGKGKGVREGWIVPIVNGHLLYELKSKRYKKAIFKFFKAFCGSWKKLSVKTGILFNIY